MHVTVNEVGVLKTFLSYLTLSCYKIGVIFYNIKYNTSIFGFESKAKNIFLSHSKHCIAL